MFFAILVMFELGNKRNDEYRGRDECSYQLRPEFEREQGYCGGVEKRVWFSCTN